jgi:hypothetical protein
VEAIRSEARLLGIEVTHCRKPMDAAAVLMGKGASPVPLEDDLGLDSSPVL